MGYSYIKQGTFVVCTNMTSGKREIGVADNTPRHILYNGDSTKPILHQWDNKISDTFICKNPIKKFGGLISMLAGIVIGAVVVAAVCAAVLVTGGAALVVIAAIIVTAALGSGAVIYSKCHDCDETLSCQWDNYHKKVTIEGGKHPLLKHSILKCTTCQGTIFLIIDAVQANKAASYIKKQNMKEIGIQFGSQFIEGFVGGLTGGCNPAALIISVGMYCWCEEENPPMEKKTTLEETVTGQIQTDLANGSIIKDGIENTSYVVDITRSSSAATVYGKEAAAHVGEIFRLNGVVDDAAINAADAAARQSAIGRTASIPGRGQWQARGTYQSAKEAADDAANALADARNARIVAQNTASEATESANNALMAAKFSRRELGKNMAKGIGAFVISVAVEYEANAWEDDIRKDTFMQIDPISKDENVTIDIIANYL